RHVVLRTKMTLERFELLSVFQADNVISCDRFLHRNRRLRRIRCIFTAVGRDARERGMNLVDQSRYFGGWHRIVAHIGRDDIRRKPDEVTRCCSFSHGCEIPILATSSRCSVKRTVCDHTTVFAPAFPAKSSESMMYSRIRAVICPR